MGQIDNELGAMRWEHVLRQQHRATVGIFGESLAAQHRRAHRHAQQGRVVRSNRVGSDGLRCAAKGNAEQFVKWRTLDITPRQVLAQLGRTPHGDHCEGLTIGEVDALHTQHIVGSKRSANSTRGWDKRELDDLALRLDAALGHLPFDGDQLPERLTQRGCRNEPSETLPGIDESFVSKRLECAPNGDPAGIELSRQFGFAGEHTTCCITSDGDAATKLICNLLVPDCSHRCFTP